jgi:hypothetical protein
VQRLSADGAPAIRFEKRLTPEVLIAAAAKATRLDAKPLADPRLIEALGALVSLICQPARSRRG